MAAAGLWLWVAACLATEYTPPWDQSRWQVSSSIFACSLTHELPFYGQAHFYQRAGERLTLKLEPDSPRLKTGQARLTARAPVWRPGMEDVDLGLVPVVQGSDPVRIGRALSHRALTELHDGRELVFTRYPWYGASESSRLALSPIRFREAYQQYLKCLAALLPVNYDQIARSAVYFPSSGDDFPAAERSKLRNIARYVLADPRVTHVYVDGHTDSKGLREENLELSKRRAESVAAFLQALGIAEAKITVRWHGERYPITSNQSRKGRAQNRRVTVRVDRDTPPQLAATP